MLESPRTPFQPGYKQKHNAEITLRKFSPRTCKKTLWQHFLEPCGPPSSRMKNPTPTFSSLHSAPLFIYLPFKLPSRPRNLSPSEENAMAVISSCSGELLAVSKSARGPFHPRLVTKYCEKNPRTSFHPGYETKHHVENSSSPFSPTTCNKTLC